uniref:Protein preY, mitochondrial n=1 Tax=Rhipicephalus appendiculatus TaxID=34631 RepID=A0A131Z4C3_RHIAP
MLKRAATTLLHKRCLSSIRNDGTQRLGFCTYGPDGSQPLDDTQDMPVTFDEENLKFIVCPVTKKPLRYDSARNVLVSDELGKAFPIQNGIPNLLPDSARSLDEM